jgi:hypothetical protein
MLSLPVRRRMNLSADEWRAAIVVVLIMCTCFVGHSQSAWEKAAWVSGSVAALGIYDYIGYNLTSDHPTALGVYRVSFVLVQAGLTYLLYEKFGLPSAIGLNLIWWTFGVDMTFYGISEISPIRDHGWSGPGSWESDSRYGVPHAGWTPVGLIRGGGRIPRNTIVAQSIVGAVIGIGISVTF